MRLSFCRLRGARAGLVAMVAASAVMAAFIATTQLGAQEAMSSQDGPNSQPATQEPAPIVREPPEAQSQGGAKPDGGTLAPLASYDPSLFQRRIPKEQLAFLSQYSGMPSNQLYREKQFRKLMHSFVPDCTFHYGSDKSIYDALDEVIQGSDEPVQIRDGRYLALSGHMGKYLGGRAFLWIDMQEGIGLGAFYFHPTNGEPTPAMNVFSKQVQKEMLLDMSELPPAFAEDLLAWTQADNVPPLTTRYFITGSNKKILLEHDEDFCAPVSGAGDNDCDQMNADAADMDMTAAEYLEQTHHTTNATAWMITDPEQVAWLQVRVHTCGGVLDPLGCRIRVTRERTRVILHAPPPHGPIARPRG